MITFKKLGKYGRLGNQMFQFAFLYNVGKSTGLDIGFDFKNNAEIAKIFKLPVKNSDSVTAKHQATELSNFGYFDVKKIPDETDFIGYFQNSRFVQDYEYDLKNIYSFDSEKMEKCHKFIKMVKEKINKQLVSIHVRRTDFLIEADTHFVCDKDYYINAINQFGNNYYYLIFTDDKEWCAKEFANIPKIIMNNNTEIDLILMSLCDHNIISNSSYSWWGSWLNENLSKTVIAPSRWYNKIAPKNWQEIYRKDMILI
jgi:hypothetical protein